MKRYWAVFILATILTMLSGKTAIAGPELHGGGSIYYVSWGDTLSSIALRYGVSVEAILWQNGLANPELIYVGQPLIIPGPAYSGSGAYNSSGCANYHTVMVGDTLSGIAWDYDVSLQELLYQNNLYNKDLLFVGQKICIPGGAGYGPQYAGYHNDSFGPSAAYYHTVVGGETLSTIAYHYGVNQWSIVQANSLSNASYIWVGQQLLIPDYHPQPPYNVPAPTYASPAGPSHDYPPSAPHYTDTYDDSYDKHRPDKEPDDGGHGQVPKPPDYKAVPAYPLLPRAEHPVEVVVNGGETWADEVHGGPDPDGITTLIVKTGDEEGKLVRIRSGDSEIKGESGPVLNGEFGSFRFVVRYIAPGDYDVWVDDPDTPSEISQVKVGAGQRVEVVFEKQVRFQGQTFASPDGWVLSAWDNPSKPGQRLGGWSNILVRTPASGLWVYIEAEGGGYKAKCLTGSKGPGACDLAALNAGLYNIWIDGTYLTIKTYMDGNAYATFDLSHQ